MRQLLAAYEAAEGANAPVAAAGSNAGSNQRPPAVAAAAAAAAASGGEADAEAGASWAGEEYEPDAVQCMQRSYLKFMKRIARQPQQCARCAEKRGRLPARMRSTDRRALLRLTAGCVLGSDERRDSCCCSRHTLQVLPCRSPAVAQVFGTATAQSLSPVWCPPGV